MNQAEHDDAERAKRAADPRRRILALALQIASYPPKRPRNPWTPTAYVPWQLIIELRQAFEDGGVDWRPPE